MFTLSKNVREYDKGLLPRLANELFVRGSLPDVSLDPTRLYNLALTISVKENNQASIEDLETIYEKTKTDIERLQKTYKGKGEDKEKAFSALHGIFKELSDWFGPDSAKQADNLTGNVLSIYCCTFEIADAMTEDDLVKIMTGESEYVHGSEL